MDIMDIFAVPQPETRVPAPYVIAEAGVNHEGSMEIARRLIDEAAAGGADAIKFQTYKAASLPPRTPRPTGTPARNPRAASTSCSKSMIPSGKMSLKR